MSTEGAGTAFQHGACIYDSDRQFLETAAPFLAEGLALGEPALVVTTPANLELIGAALGERAGEVDYAESAFFGRRPPQRVAAFFRYWRTRAATGGSASREHPGGAARVRILAEPIWAGRSAREVEAWTRMESALNVALASTSISMICPYDARTLGGDILADAPRTHPALITGGRPSPSAQAEGISDEHRARPPGLGTQFRLGVHFRGGDPGGRLVAAGRRTRLRAQSPGRR